MLHPARALRTVKTAFENLDSGLRLHHYRVHNFRGNVHFSFDRGPFTIKTATSADELEDCLRLRFEVFHKEYMRKTRATGVDVDRLDFGCDHLMIVDRRSGHTIGTYRLNSSMFTKDYYSAGEFDMGTLPDLPGTKLELGRACISKPFRTGTVISLLWRGIAEYIKLTETRSLFGCSSIKTMDPLEAGRIFRYLRAKGLANESFGVKPVKKYRFRQLQLALEYLEKNEEAGPVELPALFESYLKMNARVCGEPALDRDFYCIDFLTLIRVDEIDPAIRARFGV